MCPKEDKCLVQLNVEKCKIMRLGTQNKRRRFMPCVIIRYKILGRGSIWRKTEIKKLQDSG